MGKREHQVEKVVERVTSKLKEVQEKAQHRRTEVKIQLGAGVSKFKGLFKHKHTEPTFATDAADGATGAPPPRPPPPAAGVSSAER